MAIPSQAGSSPGRCRDWTGGTYRASSATVKGQSRPRTPLTGRRRKAKWQVNPRVVGSIPTGPTAAGVQTGRVRPSRPLAAALALSAALALPACTEEPAAAPAPSPSPTAPSGASVLKASAALTTLVGSGRYELRSATTVNGQDVVLAGDGVYDWSAHKGRTTYRIPVGAVEQRLLGSDLFFVLPQQAGVFFKVPAAQVASTPLGGTVDPISHLAALSAVGDVERVDEQEVRGTATTRYRGDYDVAAAVAAADGLQKDALRASLGAAPVTRVPFEAWVDADGYLRRFEQVVALPATPATGGQPLEVRTTLELYEFGLDVVVPGPPADMIRDGAPLLEAIRTSLSRIAPPAASPAPVPAPSPS